MSETIAVVIIAALLLGLVPIVPKMIAFRTNVLRTLHLNAFANWNERNASTLVVVVRSIFVVLAIFLLVLAVF